MKQRILSAAVGIPLLIVVLIFHQTIVWNIAMALVSMVAVYEIVHAVGYLQYKSLWLVCELFAGAVPFLKMPGFYDVRTLAILIFIFVIFGVLLAHHNEIAIGTLAFAAMVSMAIPFAFSTLIYIRDDFSDFAIYYILLVFALSWICDAGAYFAGRALGKHKMAPRISPNKTVEGAIGGIVTNLVFAVLFTFLFMQFYPAGKSVQVHYLWIVLLAVIGSLLGMMGDLSASAIKRQYQIKDFGNIIPGHGGIIDRFDSVLFVAPAIYCILVFLPVIQ